MAVHNQAFHLGEESDPPALGLRVVVTPIPGVTPSQVFGNVRQLVFPAVLNSLEITETATFSDFDSVGAGSFSIRRAGDKTARELRSFNLDVFATSIPGLAFTQNDAPASWSTVRQQIRKIFRARFPVHLEAAVVWRAELLNALPVRGGRQLFIYDQVEDVADFDGSVTFRTFTQRLEHGQPESRYFTIEVKDHRVIEAAKQRTEYGRRTARNLPVTRRIRDGDTLWKLAEIYYGRGSRYTILQRQNDRLRKVPASRELKDYGVESIRIPKPPDDGD